jgi:iron(III) transport system substrate-binding protein
LQLGSGTKRAPKNDGSASATGAGRGADRGGLPRREEQAMAKERLAALTLILGLLVSTSASAQTPTPYSVTPDLVAAAEREGQLVFYTATDVAVAQALVKAFEKQYPRITVDAERAGAERVFQRISQEYAAGIYNADVIETTDEPSFPVFKQQGWLAQAVPDDVAKLWPQENRDSDGYFANYRAHLLVIAYNTKLVAESDAPKSFADLLDFKWRSKLVKAHPGYSGAIMSSTEVLSQVLGWNYFEALGKQDVMQVQSATEPPKKIAEGERAVQIDGSEYVDFRLQDQGAPIKIVYPREGTPISIGNAAVLKKSPHPNAAKLFYAFLFSHEAQQLNSDVGGLRSFRPDVKEKPGRTPLGQIKLLHADPGKVGDEVEEIKARYERYFGT